MRFGFNCDPRRRFLPRLIFAGLTLAASLGLPTAALAQTNPLYWDITGTGDWGTALNWNSDPGGVTGTNSVPGASNDAVFSASNALGITTVQLSGPQSAMGLDFINTGTTRIDSTNGSTLSIGSDGITVNSGAGAVTLGDATNVMPLDVVGSQSWTNNSSNGLTVLNGISLDSSISSAATLTLAGSSTVNNVISGAITDGANASLGLNATGGVWLLSGTNTFSGGLAIGASSQVNLLNASAAGNGGTIAVSGGTLALDNTGTPLIFANPITISGTGYNGNASIRSTNSSSVASAVVNTVTGGVTLTGNASITASFNPLVISTGAVSLGANTLTLNSLAAAQSVTISSNIGDSSLGGGLTVGSTNAGLVVLSGTNNYSGPTDIAGGVLNITNSAALSPTTAVVQTGTGQLEIQASGTYANSLSLTGSHGVANFNPASSAGAIWLNLNSGVFTLSGPITIAAGASTEISAYSSTSTVTLSGGISDGGSGTGNLVLGGGGAATTHSQVFILPAANNSYGNTSVVGSGANVTLQIGATNALPTNTLTLQGDYYGGTALKAWLDLDGNSQQLAGLLSGTASLNGGANLGDNRVVNSGSGTPTLTLHPSGTDLFSGTLGGGTPASPSSNNFNLVMSGAGTQTVTGNSTYSGTTTISNGTLQIGNGGATGSISNTSSISDSGTLVFDSTGTSTVAAPISGNGALQQIGSGTTILNGALSYSGTTTISSGVLELNSYNNNALAGSVTLTAPGVLAPGTAFYANDPMPTSTTPITSYVIPLLASSSTGTIALTANSSENLDFSGINLGLGAVGPATYSGTLTPYGTTYRLGGGGGTLTYTPALTDVTAGSTGLVVSPGTVILTSTGNNYSGPTTINAGGTLRLGAPPNGPTTAAFTSDATSGISTALGTSSNNYNYTEALNFSGGALNINGVSFVGANNMSGTGNLGSSWTLSPNIANGIGNGANNFVAGYQVASTEQTYTLLNSFYYEGNATPIKLTLTGLTPGDLYDARVYYRTWANLDNRVADFTFNNGYGNQLLTVNEDANTSGDYIDYQYVVGPSGTVTISETNDALMIGGGSWHWYGFSNQLLGAPPAGPSNILPATTTLSMAAGSTLDLNGSSQSVQSLAGAGTVTNLGLGPATLTLTPPSGTNTFSGVIQDGLGQVALAMNGAGTEILTGTNTYSGTTTITSGMLQIGNGGTTGTLGSGSVMNNGSLVFNHSNNYIPLNAISGNGSVTTSGTAGLALLVANGYSNGTTVNGGILSLGVSSTPAGGGAITMNGGTLALVGQQSSGITAQGLQLQLYAESAVPSQVGNFTTLSTMTSHFAGLTPSVTTQTTAGALASLSWPSNGAGNLFTAQGFTNTSDYEAQLTGQIYIAQSGSYTFQSASDDGAALFIDGSAASAFTVESNNNTVSSSPVHLTAGLHTLNAGYNQGGGGASFTLSYSGPDTGNTLTTIPNSTLVTGGGTINATQIYANNLSVTATSTINVTGSLAATLGDLSISGSSSTLRITSDDTSGSPYSVTFAGTSGVTTLGGNPIFNVNPSAGGGAATLNLGGFNDGGTARVITFNGSGTINLNLPASLSINTQINIAGNLASSGPSAGLVSEYKFSEGFGTTANDSGSNRIAGTLVGPGVAYTSAAKVGTYALSFTSNTVNSYVSIPHSSLDQLSTYTVSAWVDASSFANGNATIFSTRNGGDTTFDIQMTGAGLHGDVGSGGGWINTGVNLSQVLTAGTWYLVTYAVSPTGTNVYLNDGTAATGGGTASYAYSATPMLENGSTFATIGDQEGGGSFVNGAVNNQFLGSIDDVRIYNSALTAAQVAQLYTLVPAGVTVNSNNATALGTSSQLSVGAGSTFSVGASQQVATLSGAGTVNLNSNILTVGTGNSDVSTSTFSGSLIGTGGGLTLNKASSGSLVLTGASTYTGATTISGGTLRLGKPLAPLTTYSFTSDATSGIGAAGTTNYTEALNFAGSAVTINGVNFVAANNTGGTGNMNSTWTFNINNMSTSGSFPGGFQPASGGTNTLLNNFYYEGAQGNVTLTLNGLVPGDLYDARVYYRSFSTPGDERVADFTFNNGVQNQYLTAINEDANATGNYIDYEYVAGPSGTATITEDNDPLMETGGSWHWYGFSNQSLGLPPSSNILPATTPVSLAAGGTLDLNGNSQTIASLAGAGGIVTNSGYSPATLTLAPASGSTTFSGTIQDGNETVALVLNGAGTQVLAGANTYSGGTMVTSGTLRVANTTGSATGSGPVSIASGAALAGSQTLGQGSIAGVVSLAGGSTVYAYNGATLTFATTGGLTIASGAIGNFNLSGAPNGIGAADPLISLAGTVTANGNLLVNLSGTPSTGNYALVNYSNVTSAPNGPPGFSIGTVPLGAAYQLTQGNTELDLLVVGQIKWTGMTGNSADSNWTTSSADMNWAGGSPAAASQYLDSSAPGAVGAAAVTFADTNPIGNSTIANSTVNVQSGGVFPASVTFTNNSVPYTINSSGSSVGIGGSTGITLNGNGMVTLTGANTYTGTTALNAGTLVISDNSSLGNTNLNNGAIAPLTFNGGTLRYASSSTNTDISTRAVTIASSGGATIDLNGNNVTYANSIGNSGGGSLTLLNSGAAATLTLAAPAGNSYGGATSVNAGTLRVTNTSGSATGPSGTVTVASGATLAGGGGSTPGLITGPVNILAGGTIAPANGGTLSSSNTGTLNVGALTLTNGPTSASQLNYQYSLNSSPVLDSITVTGALTLPTSTDTNEIQFNFFAPGRTSPLDLPVNNPGSPYILMTYGSLTNSFNPATLSVNPADLNNTQAEFTTATNMGMNVLELNIVSSNASAAWASNGTGVNPTDFGTAANWSPSTVPDGVGLMATFGTGSEMTVNVSGAYTVGRLVFNNSIATASSNYVLSGSGSLTLNNSGNVASINVTGNVNPSIQTTLSLADSSLTTNLNVASGSSLDLFGPVTESSAGQQVVLTGGGIVTMEGNNSYTGGTTIVNGTLQVNTTGTLSSGAVTFNPAPGNTAALNVNTNLSINNLSETTNNSQGAAQVNIASSATLTVTQTASALVTASLTVGDSNGAGVLVLNQGSANTLTISGSPTLSTGSTITVNSGTLALTNNTGTMGTVIPGGNATLAPAVSVASGATLQLAGTTSVFPTNTAGTVNVATHGTGASAEGILSVVGMTNQTVGIISGDTMSPDSVTTTYSGNTMVGDGTNAANLTATQILQNTLTINAGSTVTIAPSGPGISSGVSVAAAVATDSGAETSADSSSEDPLTAIQAAITSGEISVVKGEQLENRIAAIERLAATDPGLDVSLLEDRVLSALPSPSVWSSSGSASPIDSGSGLLAVDSSVSGSSTTSPFGGTTAAFAPAADFAGSPAAVPEPSTLFLAAVAGIGMLIAIRRRKKAVFLCR